MDISGHNISRDLQYKAFQIARVGSLQKAADEAKKQLTSELDRLNSNGLDKAAVKVALKLKEQGSAAVNSYVQQQRKIFECLAAINLSVESEQMEMFPATPSEEPASERAFRAGLLTGAMGEGTEHNPHSPETELGQSWLKGFHEGAANHRQFEEEAAAEERETEVILGDDCSEQTDIEDDE